MSNIEKAQVVVIGAGPGGYPAAFYAADLGMDVLLIDTELHPGGVCLYRGCIPSKALLHLARVLTESEEVQACGVTFERPRIDLDRVRAWKDSVVARLTGGLGQLRGSRKIRSMQGRARFLGPDSLAVDGADGRRVEVHFEHAILATGSRPATLPGWPASPRIMDSTGALALPDIPGRLLVVGGGYIGLELGSVYAALGSRVSVVEMLDGLLPGADRDLVGPLEKRLKKSFEAIRLSTRVASVTEEAEGLRVAFENAAGREEERFDRVLVSIGRKPNSEGLGLEEAGVATGPRGFVNVDAQRKTSAARIYAIGDVAGEPMLAHVATHEGRVAVEAIAGKRSVYEPQAWPAVVFTDPEIAWCGLTETQAAQAGQTIRVARFPWSASGRAMTLERQEGLTKIIADPETDRVRGLGLVGPGAGDMIAEGVLAIEMGAKVEDLALSIHPHPTLSETIMEAAEAYAGHCVHLAPAPKRH